ncbi:hypothetical protein [Hymenobacter koreensis]|uniref:T9SS type A sorting domain-containing protein n=1 Tax=Hymenobacter koreensis TaxID=1084523 RepID=A0ABP8JKU1_9BACT
MSRPREAYTPANTTALGGTYTINAALPASATNFTSFTAAIQQLNQVGVQAPVTFEVATGQTFIETLPAITTAGARGEGVTFRRAGTGTNPVIECSSGLAAVDVAGADFLNFDGIDVRAVGLGPSYGFRIRNASATNGSRNVTVQNATITLNRANPASIAVVQSSVTAYGGITPADTSGCNRNNRYLNLTISNTYNGLWVIGQGFLLPELNTEVGNVTIGNGTAGDIGGGSTVVYAMRLENLRGNRIHHNTVRGATSTGSPVYGIFYINPMGDATDASLLYGNRISGLRFLNPASTSTGGIVYGLYVAMPNTGATVPSTVSVYNNEVHSLTRDFVGNETNLRLIRGINVLNSGIAGNELTLAHNTVRIDASASPALSSSAYEYAGTSSTGGTVTLRNNVLVNATGAQTGVAKHFAVFLAGTAFGSSSSSTNYNDLHIANPANGFVGRTSAGDFATLAAWRATTNQDANSLSLDPAFASLTTLQPTNALLDNQGTPVTGIGTDITRSARNLATPDLGAYEFTVLNTRATRKGNLNLTAWPVPFGSILTVELTTSRRGTATLELLDALGRTVRQQAVELTGQRQRVTLTEMAALPVGPYLLRLRTATGQQTIRLEH